MEIFYEHWWLGPAFIVAGIVSAFAGHVGARLLERIRPPAWLTRITQRRSDRRAARQTALLDPPDETQAPGRDIELLLDCIDIYNDPAAYNRLRGAIHQHRKDNPQP